jgi:hypothetical protein
MSSLREQMLAAAQAALIGATDADDRVYRSRRDIRVQDERSAIVLVPVSEECDPGQKGIHQTHRLLIRFTVYARGPVPDQAADAICAQLHLALMADETLGGVAVRTGPVSTQWRFSDDDQDAVQVDALYEAIYSTRRASLTDRP